MREILFAENKIYTNFEVENVEIAGTVDDYFAELDSELAKAEKECFLVIKKIKP